jgi:hypothetical protein
MTNPWSDPVWPEDVVLQREDLSPSDWLLPRLLPFGSGLGTRVASIVPSGYPAYARILHPAGRTEPDPVTTWRQVDVRWRDVADWSGRTYHPLMQFERLRLARPDSSYRPPYGQEPDTGHLSSDQCRLLFATLERWTKTPEACWMGIWEGWDGLTSGSWAIYSSDPENTGSRERQKELERINKDVEELAMRIDAAPRFDHPDRAYLLAKAASRSVCQLGQGLLGVMPNLVWPEDRAWCVATEVDFDSTLIAVSEECFAALLSEDGLEVLRVEAEDRLDIDGDELLHL